MTLRTFLFTLLLGLVTLPVFGQGKSSQKAKTITLSTGETVKFLVYRPDAKPGEKLPLLLFLHGGGEGGDDLEKVKTHGPPKEIEAGREYPMIVISPLNPEIKGFWDEDRLARFFKAVTKNLGHDPERVYLAGMSRGGYGAYRLAMENPDTFAAMIVLCAAAPAPYAGWLGEIPIWLIHGTEDPVIPVSESIEMEKAISEKGGKVQLTIHPGSGHDVWTQTFSDPKTVEWLLQHKLEK